MREIVAALVLTVVIGGCTAGDEPAGAPAATTTTADATHPFFRDFPETEGVGWTTSPGQDACPSGWGSGSEDNEWDIDAARAEFAADPAAHATTAVEAVIRRFEAAGTGEDRIEALRRWLRVEAGGVVLPTGPDGPADHYMLRSGLHHVDDAFFLIEWLGVCNNVWGSGPDR